MAVRRSSVQSQGYEVAVGFEPANASIIYGEQPPSLPGSSYQPVWVLDKNNASLGPAMYFWDSYNKIVIVPDSGVGNGASRRHTNNIVRRTVAEIGDKPWVCVWNGTIIETFIYENANVSITSDSGDTYPRVVKVEESRRSNNTVKPYCRQNQVLVDGSMVPLLDSNGQETTATLEEMENESMKCGCTWIQS